MTADGQTAELLNMTSDEFATLTRAFRDYTNRFAGADGELHPLLRLKVDHCRRVATEARVLSADLGWELTDQNRAEAVGLLHDVGRFCQFNTYGTFSDAASADHGELGERVVVRNNWLPTMTFANNNAVRDAIRYHNRRVVPEDLPRASLPWVRLIRDADKLDILHLVLAGVENNGFRKFPDMLPDVSLERRPSEAVLRELTDHRSCSLASVTSLGDFLLLEISWVYDLNYTPSFVRLAERDILTRLRRQIAGDAAVDAIVRQAQGVVSERIRESAASPPNESMT